MKKILCVLSLIALTFAACQDTQKKDEPKMNPMNGVWSVNTIMFEGNDVIKILNEIGMSCISESQMTFNEDGTFSYALCASTLQGTYVYDDSDKSCTMTVKSETTGDEIFIKCPVEQNELTFTLKNLFATIDVEDIVFKYLESNGVTLDSIKKLAITELLNKLSESDGHIIFTKQ